MDQIGRATGLTYGASGAITSIQSYTIPPTMKKALEEVLLGNANVVSHYDGPHTAFITIETTDIAGVLDLEEGMYVEDVELTIASAADAESEPVTTKTLKATLSQAVVAEMSDVQKDNANKGPATQSVTFRLSRKPGDTEDPTYTLTHAAPAP